MRAVTTTPRSPHLRPICVLTALIALMTIGCAGESAEPRGTDGGSTSDTARAADTTGNMSIEGGPKDAPGTPDRTNDRLSADTGPADRRPPVDEEQNTGACVSNADCRPDQFCRRAQYGRCLNSEPACTSMKLNIYCRDQYVAFCVPRPQTQACQNETNHQVCGCDFKTYDKPCLAQIAGTNWADYDNPCPP